MNYLPKKDLFYTFAIWSLPVFLIPILIIFSSLIILTIFILSILLSFWIWNSTSYKIENGELFIKCWILRKRVNIQDIIKVKKTNNVWSSYAISTERLEITENNKSQYYISPINFDSFIEELKKYNSDIIIN